MDFLIYFISGIVIFLTFIYFRFIKRNSHVVQYLDKFPGPTASYLAGNALDLAVENHELLHVTGKWHKEFHGTFRLWLGNEGRLMMCDADIVEKVLTSSVHIDKSKDYDSLYSWLKTGLLTSTGAKWFSRRKLLTPTFHFKILEEFLEVFNEQGEVLVQTLQNECSNGVSFDIFPYLTRCALDIISETAMGVKIGAQKQHDSEYVGAIYEVGDLVLKRMLRPWLHPKLMWKLSGLEGKEKKLLKILHGFTDKAIIERKESRQVAAATTTTDSTKLTKNSDSINEDDISMTKKKRLAFLDLLLDVSDNGKVLSDADIREETDTFMFEGHDTTAANLCWTIYCLASHPKFMVKVQQELDEIFGDDRSRDVTKQDISQMKYLECCVKESLRLFPSVPLFARQLSQDIKFDDGRIIPKGTNAVIFTFYLHRDAKHFPNPEEYLPERFYPENSTGRHPYCYVPFSAGPRNCIGQKFAMMEEKIVLTKLLLNFTFEAVDDLKNIKMVPDLILRPKDGINVKMTPRPKQG